MQVNRNFADEINPARALVHNPGFGLLVLVALHCALALAMRASPVLATAHAVVTLALGLVFALFSKDTHKIGYFAAYIAGAEVLWRMTDARILWEAGKYFTVLILGIALWRNRSWKRARAPIVYFVLLCFSLPINFLKLGFDTFESRDVVSFNLSGPLALMVCALYFSQMTINPSSFKQFLWVMVMPVAGIAMLVLSGTLSAGAIVFTDESNFVTSGGFGPNQVSALLGLGGALFLLIFVMEKGSIWRAVYLIFGLGLLALGALTFSRGGIYNAAAVLALSLAHSLRSGRGRNMALMTLIVVALVGGYLIFPRLNSFTGGLLGQRFSDLDTTQRARISQADLDLWFANPLLGVGVGLSKTDRIALLGFEVAAHTEYTRMLAEHGMAGLFALLVLLFMCIRAYRLAPNHESQFWVIALLAWPMAEMSHAAMRVDAIPFLFGLAMVNWESGPKDSIQLEGQEVK